MTDYQSSRPKPKTSDSKPANTDGYTPASAIDNRELAGEDDDVVDTTTITTTPTSDEDIKLLNQDDIAKPTVNDNKPASLKNLHPFVHWSQSSSHISLRVDLIEVQDLNITIRDNGHGLEFSAKGRGAQGLQDYNFSLDFHSQVKEKFKCCEIERYVLILVEKALISKNSNWPRLTKQKTKLPWLRFDFDRYEGSDSDYDVTSNEELDNEDEEEDNNSTLDINASNKSSYESSSARGENSNTQTQQSSGSKLSNNKKLKQQQRSLHSSDPWSESLDNIFNHSSKKNFDIFNPFNKRNISKNRDSNNMKYDHRRDSEYTTENRKNCARNGLDYKKTYLFLYNLGMFVMFLKLYLVLLIKVISGTIDDDIVQGAAFLIKILTYTQLLETIHPMLKLVPGGPLMPFTQVIGRILVNYFLTEPDIRLDSAPYAHYLFIVWSSIEIFRYSYYALRVFNLNIYALTWCRYTLFMPLYPMGGFCESMVLFSTIKYYERTGDYSISLPNSANISFYLPIALRIYIFLLLGPTIYSLMCYMWKQRTNALKKKVD